MPVVKPKISISIVSHGQMDLIAHLLWDIQTHCRDLDIELILTLNLVQEVPPDVSLYPFPIRILKNTVPKGFGANHNQAFQAAAGQYFCVLNPDIRFDACPFSGLMACLNDAAVGMAAPLVVSPGAVIEDSARRFPTPLRIVQKLFRQPKNTDYRFQTEPQAVDWAGGMFMLFPRLMFAKLSGFDERYFLYYEDVDICARLGLLGLKIVVNPATRVIHHAQRSSHSNIKYLRWHLTSMMRFFSSPVYRQLRRLRWL